MTIIGILLHHFQHICPDFSYKLLFLMPPLCWEISCTVWKQKVFPVSLIILYNTPTGRLEVLLSMNLCCIEFKNMHSLIPSVLVENYIIPLEFSHFPERCGPVKDDTHIPASATQFEHRWHGTFLRRVKFR